ncbi:hypothetical protein MXMO3_00948 [Maritalea myrionectae]|uniref:Uncharacterized protein n=1 Tax=Maritalea myrionectae TaxID=454601 RepID=A0A2R4MC79_9HYPH|nr:hypothetical protein MXMO3_00948 [Maritalea myrionectae]
MHAPATTANQFKPIASLVFNKIQLRLSIIKRACPLGELSDQRGRSNKICKIGLFPTMPLNISLNKVKNDTFFNGSNIIMDAGPLEYRLDV